MTTPTIPATVARLRQTFDSGKTRPIEWRQAQLFELGRMMRQHEADFAEALRLDLGKCLFEAVLTEMSFVEAEAKYASKHLGDWMRPRRVRTPMMLQPGRSYMQPESKGVALIIAPWNYPLSMVLAPLVGAIAGGNCVVMKPSEVTANVSAAIASILPRYLDSDAFAVVEGGVPETTELLEQRFDHILYTGNARVGRIVAHAAAEHLTPVTLELGGKSPAVVDRSARLDVAARRIAWGKFLNAGQTCVAPDYVLVDRSVEAPFLDHLRATIRGFYGDDPRRSPDYARIVNDTHFRRLEKLLHDGVTVAGGETDERDRYVAPTVLAGVAPDAPVMDDEIFGPILPVLTVGDVEEAVAFVNARPKPLALYVFAEDDAVADAVVAGTSSGGVCVNHTLFQVTVPDLPFGGVGASGTGAYHGKAGFDTFTHRKSVLTKPSRPDPRLAYPPYARWKEWLVRRFA